MPDPQPPQPQSPPDPARAGGRDAGPSAADELAGLKKMSTTAGLGSEYVAINPLAIAAILLGAASLLAPVLNGDLLLLIPLAGVACAALAFLQIRRSNGTQTGRGLAAAGLALSLLIGGGTVAARTLADRKYGPDRERIVSMIDQLGQEVAAAGDAARSAPPPATRPTTAPASTAPATEPALSPAALEAARHYDAAYAMFSARFRMRVSRGRFVDAWSDINRSAATAIRGMKWNGRIEFDNDTGSGAPMASAMTFVLVGAAGDPPREVVLFTKVSGDWQIDNIPVLFPFDRYPMPKPAK